MSFYYPQGAIVLKVRWEDFGDKKNPKFKEDYLFNIQAKRIKVDINDYTTADIADIEIDYKNFPFDPRAIRSCGIQVHLEDVGRLLNDDGSQKQIEPTRDNAVFLGFADDEEIKFDDASRTVSLKGRDFTSLLIDKKFLKGTLPLGQRLDTVITGLLNENDATRQIKVIKKVTGDLPILASFWADKTDLSGLKNTQKDETYWDVIQNIVAKAGLIAYIELDTLIITKPRLFYGDPSTVKRFVYGKNLKTLSYKRKLGRRKNFNIIVRSLNVLKKEVLTAKIPAEATAAWSKETGIPNIEVKVPDLDKTGQPIAEQALHPAPYISFRAANVNSKAQLIEVGQGLYEEIGRQQIEGSFTTKEMRTSWSSIKGDNSPSNECDILKLRNGTPVVIEIDQGDLKGINKLDSLESRMRFLITRGYSQKAAAALAESLSNPRLTGPLYTKSVSFSLSADEGFGCDVEFINFIQI